MEFGLDQLRTGLRPGSSGFELSRHVEIVGTRSNLVADRFAAGWSKPNSITLSWLQTGPSLVADLLARASSLLAS